MNIVFRPASEEDIEKICMLEREIFGVDAYPKYLVRYLIENSDFFLVACIDEEVIGYICGEIKLQRGHIITLAVDSRFRGRGIGSELLKRFLNFLKEKGAKSVYLEVSVRNRRAIRFYEKHGFKIIGLISKFYNDGSDAYVMSLEVVSGGGVSS